MYKKITSKMGDRYTKDGRIIKTADVPEDVIEQLKDHASVEEVQEKQDTRCIFCNVPTKLSRYLNQETIAVCQEHYQTKTVGQTVKQFNTVQRT